MTEADSLYLAAAAWLNRGYAVIPCIGKQPAGRLLKRGRWESYKTHLPSLLDLERWFIQHQCQAYGILTGWHNLVVLDFDSMDAYFDWYRDHGIWTYQVKTARGVHVYLSVKEPVAAAKTAWGDIKAGGGYVLGAGSLHPEGIKYQAWCDADILEIEDIRQVVPELTSPSHTQYQIKKAAMQLKPAAPVAPLPPGDVWAQLENPGNYEDLITRIKRGFDILSFFPDAQPTRNGWFIARCFWHEDHHPSLAIDSRRGICKCLAGCFGGKCLDVINVTALSLGIGNQEAIEVMRRCLYGC